MSASFGASRSDSSSKPKDITPEELSGLRGPFADSLRAFLSSGGGLYGGDLVAPMTGDELSALSGLRGVSDTLTPDLLREIQATSRGDYLSAVPNNPFLGGAIDFVTRAVNDAYDEQGAANRSLFSRAGQTIQQSSPFAQAQSRIEIDRQDRLADQIAGLAMPLFEAERGRQAGAVDRARTLLDTQAQTLGALALPRLVADLGVERGQALFNERLARLVNAFAVLEAATFKSGQKGSSSSRAFNFGGGLCWVADVLFGRDSRLARAARRWCAAHPDHWFTVIYRRHGRGWARFLRRHPMAKPLAWPIWRLLAYLGSRGTAPAPGCV